MAIWRAAVIGVTGTALAVMLGLGARGVAAQCIGDGNGDNTVTIDELVKAVHRALSGCQDDGICSQPTQRFPASGQTTSYGPGSDGAVRAGAALSYTDNGDGTITDNNTGLMWEKKDDSGGIHQFNNRYTFGTIDPPYTMNGTMVTEFLATLNRPPCFANHCDWRIPNVRELESIVDYDIPYPGPTVNAAFNTNCLTGCTVNGNGGPMCSCTDSGPHWSSSTDRHPPANSAWDVDFFFGQVFTSAKTLLFKVRAVRGGL